MHDRPGVFASPPPIEVEGDAADALLLTLKAMIVRWWVLAAAWFSAGLVLALLGHPAIGAAQAAAGLAFDTGIQIHLRSRLARREAGAADKGAGIGLLVCLRFALGMAGALFIAVEQPSLATVCVLTLLQAWFLCVAVVQFAHAPRLMACAIAPVQASLVAGLAPVASAPGGGAVFAAVLLLNGVIFVVAREVTQLSWTWILATRRNLQLQRELTLARDEALRANQAKTEFLAVMSHEIRTPLNAMLGMAEVMASHDLDRPQHERLRVVSQSGADLMAVLNDILDLSKAEAGRLELEDAEFDLDRMMADMRASFGAVAAAKGVELVLEAGTLGAVRGDEGRLRQILYNLMSNAVKFTERGKVRLIARYEEGRLRAEVVDTGVGMSAETMDRLFQPYRQADAATARSFGGTGLGLSIARRLADLMGGALEASSVLGQGARFALSIPLAPGQPVRGPQAAPTVVVSPMRPALPEVTRPLRVLAADDNATNRLVLSALLEPTQCELTLVDNGREAVDAWLEQPWDLILMDIQMPVLDGIAATREIRERETVLNRPPTTIVALTAHSMPHNLDAYAAIGMDGHIAKPIDTERLYEVVSAAMARVARPAGESAARAA